VLGFGGVHRRLVHEGGYRMHTPGPGHSAFHRRDATPLTAPTPTSPPATAPSVRLARAAV
jgi:hypothetical protein